MAVKYLIIYKVYYFWFIPVTKTIDIQINGVPEIQAMEHIIQLQKEISSKNKKRRILIINFIKLMNIPEMINPEQKT